MQLRSKRRRVRTERIKRHFNRGVLRTGNFSQLSGHVVESLENRLLLSGSYQVVVSADIGPSAAASQQPIPSGTAGFCDTVTTQSASNGTAAYYLLITGQVILQWYQGARVAAVTQVPDYPGSATSPSNGVRTNFTFNQSDAGTPILSGRLKGDYILYSYFAGDGNFAPTHQFDASDYATTTSLGLPSDQGNFAFAINFSGSATSGVESQVSFIQQPQNAAEGDTLKPPVTVALQDSTGATVTTSSSLVDLTLSGGSGTLSGTTSVQAINGIATFSDLSVDQSGNYNITASSGTDTSALSSAFTITSGKLVFIKPPHNGSAGASLAPSIEVALENAKGKIDTTNSSSVVVLSPIGFTSANPITGNVASLVNGIATFSGLQLAKPGFYQLQADDGGDTQATSGKFKITGDHIVIKAQPMDTDPNHNIPIVVELLNAKNQPDVNAATFAVLSLNTVAGGIGAILSNTALLPFVAGFARFTSAAGPSINVTGTYNLTVTEEDYSTSVLVPTNTTTDVTSRNFDITGVRLKVIHQPGNEDVNTGIPLQVAIEDSKGRIDRTQNGAGVQLTLNPVAALPAPAVLSGLTTANFVNGVAQFTAAAGPLINLPGDYTFTASDPTTPAVTSVDSKQFTVAGLHLVFKKQVTTAGISAPILLTVEVLDSKNRLFTSENSATVQLDFKAVLGGVNAVLSGTVVRTFTGGIADFTLAAGPELDTAGTYRFIATETGTASGGVPVSATKTGLSNPIIVTGNHLKFLTAPPNTANVNNLFPITVAIVTKNGARVVSQNTDSIQLSLNVISGGVNALLASSTGSIIQPCAFGASQFQNIFLNSPGTYTITATQIDATTGGPSKSSVPVTSKPLKVQGLHVEVISQPQDALPYQPIAMKFALEDSRHNIDTAATGYVLDLTMNTLNGGANAVNLGGGTFTDFVNGIAEYTPTAAFGFGNGATAIDDHPGTFSFDADARTLVTGAAAVKPGKTHPFKILPLHLVVQQQPLDTPVLGPIPFKVSIEGPNHQLDTFTREGLGISINTLSGGAGAALTDNIIDNSFPNGIANFDFSNGGQPVGIDTTGTYTFTFAPILSSPAAAVPATAPITSSPFKITPVHLAITQQPANVAANAPVQIIAKLEDVNNNPVINVGNTAGTLSVQVISGGVNVMLANPSGSDFVNSGVYQPMAALNVPGIYQLAITISQSTPSGELTIASATSDMFTIT